MRYSVSYVLAQKFATQGRQYSISNDDLSTIVYHDKGDPITMEQLVAADAQLQLLEYKAQRTKEYPSVADQLDMLWHAMDTGEMAMSKEFYTSCKAVKDKYPKPV